MERFNDFLYLCKTEENAKEYLKRCWFNSVEAHIFKKKKVEKRCFRGTVVWIKSRPNYLEYLEQIGSGEKVCCWFKNEEDRNRFKEYFLALFPKDSVELNEFYTESYYGMNDMPGLEFWYRQQPHEE